MIFKFSSDKSSLINLITGSAHTVLAPYWAPELGLTSLTARQCSPRGGDLSLRVREDTARLEVAGDSTVVMEGVINVK